MTNRTITSRSTTLTGSYGGATFANGTATVDDATKSGKAAIAYAKRHGWAVSGGIAAAVDLTIDQGEALIRWTRPELEAYLDAKHIDYPDTATDEELRDCVRDAIDIKAQGGSAANESAGHTSGTYPPQGAPDVSNPDKPDDHTKTPLYSTPLSTVNEGIADPPVITDAPDAIAKVQPATATFNVTASGVDNHYQWQRQTRGAGAYVDIPDADGTSYVTPATSVAENHLDRYRVIVTNENGSVTSAGVQLTVTNA